MPCGAGEGHGMGRTGTRRGGPGKVASWLPAPGSLPHFCPALPSGPIGILESRGGGSGYGTWEGTSQGQERATQHTLGRTGLRTWEKHLYLSFGAEPR